MRKLLFSILSVAAISLAGCSDNDFPSEAVVGVVYSPEVSALWNERFPPIRLAEGEKRFTYYSYDVGGAVCKEHAFIDNKRLYDYLARPERCGRTGFWRSTKITFEDGKYKVFVPEESIDMFRRDATIFNKKNFDEFVAQFMVTAPVSMCNTAPNKTKCDRVLWGYRIANYTDADLNTKKAIEPNMSFPYYPKN